jgi:NTE family protein
VRALTELKVFVAATNVHTGRIKIFEGPELTADHVMASACLPYLFQAVEIDGVPYWDGGFMGNPALFPLFFKTACPDIVIVQIKPVDRTGRDATFGERHSGSIERNHLQWRPAWGDAGD